MELMQEQEKTRALLELSEKGKAKNSVTNTELILSKDPVLRRAIRFNKLTQRINIVRQIGWDNGSFRKAIMDNDLYNIHLYCKKT